ncbi:MAG: Y-family DNA polymerase [Phycisphaerae bacterium]|nr:Y-family DNA polymerase [Phycisphaerae bacterium]MBT5383027.1 Y-family DNA polymerase [Phycisphaerae bacterium]MBT5582731.1 Y-family DNA polymerase [Phycisphaerae bacterium]
MYALADCNNFYATCERVFQPRLASKPIIVLSNNDGCVVARSQEAKDLGIRMGQPVFQCRDVIRTNNVVVRSSNYALYEDMSRRVVSSILNFIPDVEIYSIDEVFFDLTPEVDCEPEILCRKIQSTVLQWTGVPVSIGIGPTKTLAKLANRVAKKDPLVGSVYRFPSHDLDCRRVLAATPIEEVWGIGRQWGKRFKQIGVDTALGVVQMGTADIRSHFNVTVMRTAMELSGIPCQNLESAPVQRRSLVRSRSFGRMVTRWGHMSQAIASHAIRAAEKLRAEGGVAGRLTVFIHTNRFRKDLPQHCVSGSCELLPSTNTTPVILKEATAIGRRLWKQGLQYKKAGVMLSEITFGETQGALFSDRDYEQDAKLMQVMDRINVKMGSDTLHPAASGLKRCSWFMQQGSRSPRYTTRWDELPKTT